MKIDDDVLLALEQSATEGNLLRLRGQLDRELYERVDKVLMALGAKWKSGKVKAHVFDGDAAERVDEALSAGMVTTAQEIGFFETPEAVVDMLMAATGPWLCSHPYRVLEPSAGRGAIAYRLLNKHQDLVAVENNADNAKRLRGMCGQRLLEQDFLKMQSGELEPFDRVLMNPPFSKQQDIAHVTHALQFLRPGGVLAAIMSAGVTFRRDSRTIRFKQLIEDLGGEFEMLPEESFKASGTLVRTCLLTVHKSL